MHTDTQGHTSPQQAPQGAQDESTLEATAPGQMRVIKRNGKVVAYTDDKITVAISKAFLAVEGGTAAASSRIHETVQRLTEQVTAIFKRRMPSGGTIHIEEIQDQVELALMRAGEQKIARAYVLYDLGEPSAIDAVYLQGDNNDRFVLEVSDDGAEFAPLWTANAVGAPGLRSRSATKLGAHGRFVRLSAIG
ncbi:MAG: ATP cone domain-containing protein, partial [Halioglobus sp.]